MEQFTNSFMLHNGREISNRTILHVDAQTMLLTDPLLFLSTPLHRMNEDFIISGHFYGEIVWMILHVYAINAKVQMALLVI